MRTARTSLLLLAATGLCLAQALPTPVISLISPSSVVAGSSSFTLTVYGQNFGTYSQVLWNGSQLPNCVYDAKASTLTCPVAAALVASPGTASIQVVNTYPPSAYIPPQYSNTVIFTIIAPPVISAINPTAVTAGATGVVLIIQGSGFLSGGDAGSLVQWSGPTTSGRLLQPDSIASSRLGVAIPDDLLTAAGTATIYVVNRGTVYSNAVSLPINPPLVITTTSLPNGTVGVAYSASPAASGGTPPYSWSISGDFPPGLTFDASAVTIKGTPTEARTFSFTARVTDAGNAAASRTITLTIVRGLTITTESLPNGTVGVAYSAQLAAAGGTGSYSWSATGLPAWLTLNASSGVLAGTPTAAGTYSFTVQVTDSAKSTDSKAFSITIVQALAIATASPLPGGTVGTAYSQTLAATGGILPYSWSATGLPTWLALNASTGVLAGTPAAAGAYNFTVQVTDGAKSTASKAFTITIIQALTILTTSPLPGGTVASSYSQKLLAFGGVQPYIWAVSAGSVPPGLRLLGDAGDIMGTPTTAGTYSFTAQVTDTAKSAVTKAFTISVAPFGLPNVTLSGLTDTTPPAQQPRVQLGLTSAAPAAITGRITLTFTPDAVVSGDNPTVQFSTGGRTVDFTVPAGGNRATFGNAQDVSLQVGTVAGTITLTVRLQAGGVDVTPSPAPTVTTRVARAAPVITSAQVVRSGAGFEVRIIGYSTPRQVTSATFRFSVTGADLQTSEVTVSVDSAFGAWYRSEAAGPFGGEFRYVQPFTMSGDATAVTALTVTVTLSNATGTSASASGSF